MRPRHATLTPQELEIMKLGDRVILSDMSQFENADRIHLTDEQHVRKQ
jgi:hypothetical protein